MFTKGHEVCYVECSCGLPDHHLVFSLWDWDDDTERNIFVSHHLNDGPWWNRLWVGIRHILRGTKAFGHYDETIIDREGQEQLLALLGQALGSPNTTGANSVTWDVGVMEA